MRMAFFSPKKIEKGISSIFFFLKGWFLSYGPSRLSKNKEFVSFDSSNVFLSYKKVTLKPLRMLITLHT